MAKPAVLMMISGASTPTVSNTFVNNNSEICTLQISGTFTSATVKVEGIVDINSGKWVSLATFDLTDLDLKTNGMSDKSLYRVGIAGILRVRISLTAINGGDITVMANFVDTEFYGKELPPSSEAPFTAYDLAVLGGYTGTQADYEAALADIVEAVPLSQQMAGIAQEAAERAASSATYVQNYAVSASNSASNAGISATNASESAADAASSASAALGSATAAANSATRAANSASSAENSAVNASISSSNAAVSASNAATSASGAANSAANASGSAANASNSAASAANSAANAADSATRAATSATSAQNAVGAIAPAIVTEWLDENVNPVGSAVVVDSSLSISGAAADAKITGDFRTAFNTAIMPVSWAPNLTKGAYIDRNSGKSRTDGNAVNYARTGLWNGYGYRIAVILDNPNYEYRMMYYTADGTLTGNDSSAYLGCSEFVSGLQYVPSNAILIALSIRRVDQAEMTDAYVEEIAAALSAYAPTDRTLSLRGIAADAKTTGDFRTAVNAAFSGHVSDPYTQFNPTTNNTVNTKLSDGVYRIATNNSSALSSCYYSMNSSHALYNQKIRVIIKNNASVALDLYTVQFSVFEGTLSSTAYENVRYRFLGNIENGDLFYYDFIPSQSVKSAGATCSIYLLCPAGASMDITVSLGVLNSKDEAMVSDNESDIDIDDTAIIASTINNIVGKKVVIDADWETGTILNSNSVYVRQYRPYSMISRNLDLTDYFGEFIHLEFSSGYKYRPFFFADSTFTTLASGMNVSAYVTNKDLFVKTPYVIILALRTDEAYLTKADLTAVKVYADLRNDEESAIFGNYCDESSAFVGYTAQSATGWMLPASNRILSDWIEIPESNPYGDYMYDSYKYTIIASKVNDEWGYNFNHCVFYDENKQLLSATTSSSQPVLTNKSAKYIRAIFVSGSTNLYVGFNADGSLPAWEPYKPIIPSNKITSLGDSVHNSDGAVTSLLQTCLAYAYNDEFGYGNHYTAYHENCEKVASDGVEGGTSDPVYEGLKYQIDCSAFVRLALQNVLPENSRYMSNANSPAETGYVFNDKVAYDNSYGRLTANKLAKYAFDNGWLYVIDSDMSNVEVGDVLFLCNQSPDRNFFLNIGHTIIVAMKWKNINANEYRVRTIEARSSGLPIYSRTLSKNTLSTLIYGARFPLRYCGLDVSNIIQSFASIEQNVNLASGEYTGFNFTIDRTIKAGDIFTVCIKASIPQNTHFELYGGSNALGLTGSGVWYGNSGEYTLYGLVRNDQTSAIGANALTVRLVAESAVSDTVTIDGAKIVRGYYTPSVKEL